MFAYKYFNDLRVMKELRKRKLIVGFLENGRFLSV
jgi:hypothetical protein